MKTIIDWIIGTRKQFITSTMQLYNCLLSKSIDPHINHYQSLCKCAQANDILYDTETDPKLQRKLKLPND